MADTSRRPQRANLDDLAFAMATATDTGDLTTARRILQRLETAVGIVDDDVDDAAPVLARRFARAHREALRLHDDVARVPLDDVHAIAPIPDGDVSPRSPWPAPVRPAPSAVLLHLRRTSRLPHGSATSRD